MTWAKEGRERKLSGEKIVIFNTETDKEELGSHARENEKSKSSSSEDAQIFFPPRGGELLQGSWSRKLSPLFPNVRRSQHGRVPATSALSSVGIIYCVYKDN